MATRITIDRKLPIKASANPQMFSRRREFLGYGTHPRKPVFLEFSSVFNSSHREVGLPQKKVFVNSLSVLINLVQQSSSFKEYLQYSGRFLQPCTALKFLQGVPTLVWYISSFHRHHFPSSYQAAQLFTYDKLY